MLSERRVTTADGVPVTVGDTVWMASYEGCKRAVVTQADPWDVYPHVIVSCAGVGGLLKTGDDIYSRPELVPRTWPTVTAGGIEFELVESITTEGEGDGSDWHTVLVFYVYGDVPGGRVTVCEARVEVRHERTGPSTQVRLVSVADCYGPRGDLRGGRDYAEAVKAGRLRVPGQARALISGQRPMLAKVAESVQDRLFIAASLYGPWPHLGE